MKKNRKLIILTGLSVGIFLATGAFCTGQSRADKAKISGKGNFIFESNGKEVGFYAEDITYLQEEITKLFKEMEREENENE